ncbi:hypothetical protein B0J11DRAFT_521754 [Dendryphion nanum]|uniref:Uncharacterized protein n=1 Tax=Dendryphion nanum TaxID=256645 RepID=A0A9P9E8E9_9PLEO|nr:hypothetical protein B0J11DRAFT_521754 [Dendryphion nanum]
MRSFFIAAAALCSLVSAAPAVLTPPPAGTQFYQLQSKSPTTAVNNQWVALKTGATTYSLASSQTAATKFWFRKYDPTGTYLFFNADDTRQVALQGPNGTLLYAVDVINPNTGNIPGGQLMEWGTFTTDANVVGVKDGSTLTTRTFVGVKVSDGYNVAFYDGISATTQTIAPLTLNIVKAT